MERGESGHGACEGTVYERLTLVALEALRAGRSPREAWAHAQTVIEGRPSTLAKGCPRSTFVSLAEHGYIAGYVPEKTAGKVDRAGLSLNARHALDALQVWQKQPELIDSRRRWWAATRSASGTSRENQAGILDVLRGLILADAFRT